MSWGHFLDGKTASREINGTEEITQDQGSKGLFCRWGNWGLRPCLLTNLAADDWRPHDQTHKLVQHVVREGDEELRACEAQGCQAGPQLLLHGALTQHAVLEPEWEGALLQDMNQGEELIQVWVLGGGVRGEWGGARAPGSGD